MAIQSQPNLVAQEFTVFTVAVAITPTPIAQQMQLTSLITTIEFSLVTGSANSVFMGGPGVTTATGLEIVAGIPKIYKIIWERNLIEVANPLNDMITAQMPCGQTYVNNGCPRIVWDLSQIYLIAVAPTNINVGAFKEMYI